MKRIFSILIIVSIIVIMALPSMAWDAYPDTPSNERYDDSYIYQAITIYSDKIWLSVSDTPFYWDYDAQYRKCLDASGDIYLYQYVDGNWAYSRAYKDTHGQRFNNILESTHDIYTNSTLTDVFFSATLPMPMPPIQETLTQHPPLTLMKSRLVGLIPLLIGLLIVSVGFYKGLSVLFKALRRA